MSNKYTEQEAKQILEAESSFNASRQVGPMPLRTVRHYFNGLKKDPEDIRQDSPSGVVFYNLCICYQNNNSVSEGAIDDVIWGFRQSGIPPYITQEGFKGLKNKGYITYSDPHGRDVIGSTFGPGVYYKWTNRFFELLLEKEDKEKVSTRHEIKDIKSEDLG